MFIEAPLNGRVRKVEVKHPDDAKAPPIQALRFALPICFRDVSTVKEGLISCEVSSARVYATKERLRLLGQTVIFPYANPPAENPITDTPIQFRPDAQDVNTLSVEFTVCRREGELDELDTRDLALNVVMVFKSLHRLVFLADVEPQVDAQLLKVRRFRRAKKPGPVLANLVMLVILLSGLSWWNFGVNAGVVGQPSWLQQNAISVAIGVILAFFGLSFSRIQSWFRTLANVRGLLNFPELHIDTTVSRVLSTRVATFALVVLASVGAGLVWYSWSHRLPLLPDEPLGYFHRRLGVWVDSPQKVYRRDLKKSAVVLGCKSTTDNGKGLEATQILGYLEPKGALHSRLPDTQYQLVVPASWAPNMDRLADDPRYARAFFPGKALLDAPLEKGMDALRGFLCEGQLEKKRVRVVPDAVRFNEKTIAGFRLEQIDSVPHNTLWAKADRYREDVLMKLKWSDLWDRRFVYSDELRKQLLEATPMQVSNEELKLAVETLVHEVKAGSTPDKEQAVERLIEIDALVGFVAERAADPNERTARAMVDPIVERFDGMIWGRYPWQVLTMAIEILLRVEAVLPDESGNHAETGIRQLMPAVHAEPVYHYLAACLRHEKATELLNLVERRKFLADAIERVTDSVGRDRLIENVEKLVPDAQRQDVRDAVLSVLAESPLNSDA